MVKYKKTQIILLNTFWIVLYIANIFIVSFLLTLLR